MRKLILLLFIIFSTIYLKAQVNWVSFSQAIESQKKEPKKIVIIFYSDWCTPCKAMEKGTYNNPIISEIINNNFYPVKFESDGDETIHFAGQTFRNTNTSKKKSKNQFHQFTQYMNINMIPTMVFLDENTNAITNLSGYLSAKEVEPYFNMIANNHYKSITNQQQWEQYLKKFNSKIKK